MSLVFTVLVNGSEVDLEWDKGSLFIYPSNQLPKDTRKLVKQIPLVFRDFGFGIQLADMDGELCTFHGLSKQELQQADTFVVLIYRFIMVLRAWDFEVEPMECDWVDSDCWELPHTIAASQDETFIN